MELVGRDFVEKVVLGLESHLGDDGNHYDCEHCPYGPMSEDCDAKLIQDALVLAQTYTTKDEILNFR